MDQVGLFANSLPDLALLGNAVSGFDAQDPASYLLPRPDLTAGYEADPPIDPNFAWIDMPYHHLLSSDTIDGFEELMSTLGGQVDRISAPQSFSILLECLKVIYAYEIYHCLERERREHTEQLSDTMKAALDKASTIQRAQYEESLEVRNSAINWFREFFNDYDAILTPSALGEAPKFDQGTGDPICCSVWTLCGLPCISLPLLMGHNNLPIGVQLVANRNEDDRLFRTTKWLLQELKEA